MGVFVSDLSLVPIQTYTTDRVKLRKAIDDAATRATSVFESGRDQESTRAAQSVRRRFPSERPGRRQRRVRWAAGRRWPGCPVHRGIGRLWTANRRSGVRPLHSSWERLAREQQGYASLNALRAVIEGLSVLPGRKSVVFFAEGLALPEAVMPQFDSVVATANRANVSVYTIDAAGLRVHSKDAETGREVRADGQGRHHPQPRRQQLKAASERSSGTKTSCARTRAPA